MFQPGPKALFTLVITMGSLAPAAQWSISCIRASPWEDVAVKALAPADDAPMHAAMAECSDSTLMNSAFISPLATISDIFSTVCV
jgi:hypothetical protein